MSSIGGSNNEFKVKTSSTSNGSNTPTNTPSDDFSTDSTASDLNGLKNQRSAIRDGINASNQNVSLSNSLRSKSLSQAKKATESSLESKASSRTASRTAFEKSAEAGDLRLQAHEKQALAKSKGGAIGEQLKQQAEQAKRDSLIADFEAQKARNEEEVFSRDAAKSAQEADNAKQSANSQTVSLSASEQSGSQLQNNLNNVDSQLAQQSLQQTTDASNVSDGGSATDAGSDADGNFDDFSTTVNSNSPGSPFLQAAESLIGLLANLVRQSQKLINPTAKLANSFTQKTVAQQAKSTIEAGLSREVDGATNVAFRLRTRDTQISAIMGNVEEKIKGDEERAKLLYITQPKQTNDFVKPA